MLTQVGPSLRRPVQLLDAMVVWERNGDGSINF